VPPYAAKKIVAGIATRESQNRTRDTGLEINVRWLTKAPFANMAVVEQRTRGRSQFEFRPSREKNKIAAIATFDASTTPIRNLSVTLFIRHLTPEISGRRRRTLASF
jgi:hypothetical protein